MGKKEEESKSPQGQREEAVGRTAVKGAGVAEWDTLGLVEGRGPAQELAPEEVLDGINKQPIGTILFY